MTRSRASGDGSSSQIDLTHTAAAADLIARLSPAPQAVVAVDDQGVIVATEAATRLGLPANPLGAVTATRDKLAMRRKLAEAGVAQPSFRAASPGRVPAEGSALGYPVVVKPVGLSASRGVIRADTWPAAEMAEQRIRAILKAAGRDSNEDLLVEEYVPGAELIVEALLIDGTLEPLAIIDKPDPLEGPFFEETLLITPSRHPEESIAASVTLASAAAKALGLRLGPVHAEVRIPADGRPVLIELAARSIGGLCGRALSFGLLGESLEVMILRTALGIPSIDRTRSRRAIGVFMLPIPATGTLTGVGGVDQVKAMEGIDDVIITVPRQRRVAALPEGDRYLGFVFASGPDPETVEHTLRKAGSALVVEIDGEGVSR